jgi:hypothetical protein
VNLKELWLTEKPMEKILPLSAAFPQPGLPAIFRTSGDLDHRTGVGPASLILSPKLKVKTSRTRVGELILSLHKHHLSLLTEEKIHDSEALQILI